MSDTSLESVLSRPYKVLKLILEDPGSEPYLEDLTRRSDISKMSLSRILNRMESQRILKSRFDGYRKYWRVRPDHLTPALKLLINLDSKLTEDLIKRFRNSILILYGSRGRGTNRTGSDWDLILIDDKEDILEVNEFINHLEKKFDTTIDMKVYSREQFIRLKKELSPFYLELISSMYILIGDINGL